MKLTKNELLMLLEYQRFSWIERRKGNKSIYPPEDELKSKLEKELTKHG